MFKKIAAFGAHPDDLEIGCFGTIAQLIQNGAHVDLFIATGNSQRLDEAKNAAKSLGGSGWKLHELGYENNRIPYSTEIIQDIDKRLEETNPDLVITHWVGDNQQDHQNIAKATISACRKRDTIWMMEPPHGRPPVKDVFRPQVYVDISDSLSKKQEAILRHKSQFDRLSMKDNFDPWTCRSKLHGTSLKVDAAEVFEVVKQTVRFT